jgi:glycosyltransferase involved in cell wall biosynthesis
MRVAVVNTQTPFEPGRTDWVADRLCEALQEHGHATDLVRIPFTQTPPEVIVDQMLAVRLIRLANVDRAVALAFPSYFLPHGDKVVWLVNQFRQAYDGWGTPPNALPHTALGRHVRSAVQAADHAYLAEATRIYAPSAADRHRLSSHLGLASEVLYPPLRDPQFYRCDAYGDYVLALGSITANNPQRLAVAAMGLTQSAARLVIAGPPESPDSLSALRQLAIERGVEDRIEFMPERIDDAERVRLIAGCRAVLCLPSPEDSCTHVVLEAFQSQKSVVTFTEPGDVLELVRDGLNGRVAASVPALAAAVDELAEDPALAQRYGDAAFRQLHSAGISWETVVRELTR